MKKVKIAKTVFFSIIFISFIFFIVLFNLTGCQVLQGVNNKSIDNTGATNESAGNQLSSSFKSIALPQELDFTLKTLEGDEITLSGLKGKVVVLNFWATWCPPCKAEIPDFIEVYSQYKDKGVEFLGVSSEQPSIVSDFAKNSGINYPILIDQSGKVFSSWGINSIPTTFIIDSESNIVYGQVGMMAKEKLIIAIEQVLK